MNVSIAHRLARAECIAASLESQLLAVGSTPDYRYLPNTKPSGDLKRAIGQPLLESADAIVKSSKKNALEEIAKVLWLWFRLTNRLQDKKQSSYTGG